MGQPASKEARSEKARSDAIDRQITEDSKRYKKECKILLLGSGESGKSTIVKQMKIIHQTGFDERERVDYRAIIYKNVLDSARTLARVVRRVGIGAFGEGREREYALRVVRAFPPVRGAAADGMGNHTNHNNSNFAFADDGSSSLGHGTMTTTTTEDESTLDTIEDDIMSDEAGVDPSVIDVGVDPVPFTRIEEREERRGIQTGRVSTRPGTAEAPTPTADVLAETHAILTPALVDAIWHVARAEAVERMVDDHPGEFYLMDSAGYFFSSIHRIAAPTYVPSEEDVLRARAKSTAIIETRFWMGDLMIHMFDVGGQRSERKKWIHCFESVTSIIFCTALSEYDQVLEEERRVNRMRESLYLFESVINSRWFLRTSVILFLNKIDVFKRKLPKIPLGRFFPEYAGGNDLQKAAKYILWKFMQENRAKLTVYPQ
ncbi:heterotrimeric G-protein alpha subunit [Favolaschia claudopus]|uniref:Heterotrimeric G-protein alpha subunit n=1 Tax=Favolaschia claudopus TaxID=2862362 RepID=A0AAW0DN66_9AGAR